jgi:hypothetical protein
MNKAIQFLAFTILIIAINEVKSFAQDYQQQNKAHIIKLFNGQNLDGWYTFLKNRGRDNDPNSVFTVQEGVIKISGKEWGCITTNNEFENYKITIEYKWGNHTYVPRENKARDSGLLLHSIGKDGAYNGTWMYSIECNIIEGGTGDFVVVGDGTEQFTLTSTVAPEKQGNSYIFQPTGNPATVKRERINWIGRDPNWQDVKNFRGENDIENPIGEWNSLECIVDRGEISIFLNGKFINHATNVQPSKGHIQIQSEGAEIFFREIALTPIP